MSEIPWCDMNSPQAFVAACVEQMAPGFLPTGNWVMIQDHWVGWITDFRRYQRARVKIDLAGDATVMAHIHLGLRYRRPLP